MIHRLTIYDNTAPKEHLDFFEEIPANLMDKHVSIKRNNSMDFERFNQITKVIKHILTETFISFKIDGETSNEY
jgi:hypothetical protein